MRRLRSESGSALVAAVILMGVMTMTGFAVFALADTQGRQSANERLKESGFNVAEAALEAQVGRLSASWPASTASAYDTAGCGPATGGTQCPDSGTINGSTAGPDAQPGTGCPPGTPPDQWRTSVHDNPAGATDAYVRSIVDAAPGYDANGDHRVWVRADGVSQCRTRSLIAMVRSTEYVLAFPRNAITANWFRTTNNGNKIIVDTLGAYAQPVSAQPGPGAAPGAVSVRCDASSPTPCLDYDPAKGQIAPDTAKTGSSPDPAIKGKDLKALKDRAVNLGTYYPSGTCPPTLTGQLVYVENLNGCPYYDGGNTSADPGMLVVGRGVFRLTGNDVFYGLLYMRNEDNLTTEVVDTQGDSLIQGSVIIDGPGGMLAGSSKTNMVFDARVFDLGRGFAGAVVSPESWREVPFRQ